MNHTYGCWEVLLFVAGYVIGPYYQKGGVRKIIDRGSERGASWHTEIIVGGVAGHIAISVATVDPKSLRTIKALVAKRRREGMPVHPSARVR